MIFFEATQVININIKKIGYQKMDNNHWSCIKIGFQITQNLDEFSILYERMKCMCAL
jgi:hypothetical protein